MSMTQKMIPQPEEISAAKAWFASQFDPEKIAGSFSNKDGKLSGLLSIPPVGQSTLNAILVFAQTAIAQDAEATK